MITQVSTLAIILVKEELIILYRTVRDILLRLWRLNSIVYQRVNKLQPQLLFPSFLECCTFPL